MNIQHNRTQTALPSEIEHLRAILWSATADMIIKEVSLSYQMPIELIYYNTHKRDIAEPRQVAMYFMTLIPHMSLSEIAAFFKMDHSSVVHSRNTVVNDFNTNNAVKDRIIHIAGQISNATQFAATIQLVGAVSSELNNYRKLKRKFMSAELKVHKLGYRVINPLKIVDRNCSRKEAIKICLNSIIDDADGIALLPDWQLSPGALTEYHLAKYLQQVIINL